MSKFTKDQHWRAVAAVKAGCSVSGVAKFYGFNRKHLQDILKQKSTQDEIDKLGKLVFLMRHAVDADVEQIKARTAQYSIPQKIY